MVLLPILMSIEQPLTASREKVYKLVMSLISKEVVDPVKKTAAEDRHIGIMHLRDRFKSASETARNWRGHVQ